MLYQAIAVRIPDRTTNIKNYNMKKRYHVYLISFAAVFISGSFVLLSAQKSAQETAILKINKEYDKRTVIRRSTIPNAGNGLFAAVRIKKGEVIGELGGRLVSDNDPARSNHYIAAIPECAWEKTHPYKYIDSKDYGAHVSRINFAPSEINGIETNFQNATIKQLCRHPYFVFIALKDIAPGAEIWSSYGPNYEYDEFMSAPEVRDFFCSLLKMDCGEKFTYLY
jgi:SET domain-containing protein